MVVLALTVKQFELEAYELGADPLNPLVINGIVVLAVQD